MAVDTQVLKDWLAQNEYLPHVDWSLGSLLDWLYIRCSGVRTSQELDHITQQLVNARVFKSCTPVAFYSLRDHVRMEIDYRAHLHVDGARTCAVNFKVTDRFSRDAPEFVDAMRERMCHRLALHVYELAEDRLTP